MWSIMKLLNCIVITYCRLMWCATTDAVTAETPAAVVTTAAAAAAAADTGWWVVWDAAENSVKGRTVDTAGTHQA